MSAASLRALQASMLPIAVHSSPVTGNIKTSRVCKFCLAGLLCLNLTPMQRTDAPVSRKEVSEQAMGPPKAINTAATRFSAAAAAAGHRSASGGAGGGMMGGGGSHMSLDVHGAAVADAMGLGSVHGAGHDQLPGGAPLPGGGTMG